MKPIILVVGTRAEAIKLIPVYLALQQAAIPCLLCSTSQHRDMLNQVFSVFNVTPDFDLNIMKENQDLFYITQATLEGTKKVYLDVNPSLVMVHGDTTSTMAGALSAFYLHIPIAHIEAGMRTGNINAPFPEEMNRKLVGQIASYHFAPTAVSAANLLSEGVDRTRVFITGNTIIDALHHVKNKIENHEITIDAHVQQLIKTCKATKQKTVLLTAHRRESFNGGLTRVFTTMRQFAQNHCNVTIIFPVHPNPNVHKALEESGMRKEKNIVLLEPVSYTNLIYLLSNVDWVATDSGGIQEEATSLGKRVLVLRDITERWEGVWEGIEILVGTNSELIMHHMEQLYSMPNAHIEPSGTYGDGKASSRIISILKSRPSTESLTIKTPLNSCNKQVSI